MFNRSAVVCLSLIGLSALGCSKETTSSKNIKTGGIAALIDVYADTDTKAVVHVKLVVGGSSSNAYVDLEGQDALIATADDQSKTLSVVDTGIYEATFSNVGEDTAFTVTLDRPEDSTASENSGTLPAPFSLDRPTEELSRKDDALDVSWTPDSNDEMNLDFDGDCIFSYEKDVSDTGAYTVKAGGLKSTSSSDAETCDIDLLATRSRSGSADSQFDKESYFRLHQRRKTTFTSTP